MKKTFTISIEVGASQGANQPAFEALVAEAVENLKKAVAALDNVVTLKAGIIEAGAPAPAPAPPAVPKPA
jgi:hypothetical protein